MFFSRNRTCIVRLAKKELKSRKTRNVIIVLAIVLTTILFTSMMTICLGTYQSVQTTMQMQKGSKADGDVRYLTKEQFYQLSENKDLKTVGCRRPIGFASNSINHNIEIDYMDQTEQELTFNVPSHGTAPQKANEIATTDKALESLGVTPKVGEKVEIEFELRGEKHTYQMTVSGWWEASNSQVSLLLVSEKFMDENEELFPYTYDEDMEYAGTYFSDIVFESKNDVEQQIDELIDGFNTQVGKEVVSGAANLVTNPSLDFTVVFALVIFVILFVLASYLLINNIYSISAMQDVQNYGLLKTIGTTQSQIALLVKIQTLWLLIIGIPIGLFIGYFIGKAILPFAMDVIASQYSRIAVVMTPTPLIFIIATIFSVITVSISIRKPLRTVAKISPLAAIKITEVKKSRKKKRTHKFSIMKMAGENFKRNTKKSVFIIMSITLCCGLFNSVLVLANSINIEKAIKLQSAVDIQIGSGNLFNNLEGYSRHSDGLDPQMIVEIERNFQADEAGIIYKNTLDDMNVTFDYSIQNKVKIESDQDINYMITDNGRITLGNDNLPICNVYGIDNNVYQRMEIIECYKDINPDELFEKLSQENYLIEAVPAPRNSSDVSFQCDLGQQIKVSSDEKNAFYTVIAHAYVSPTEYEAPGITTGLNKVGGDAPMFYLAVQAFTKLYTNPTIMSYTFNTEKLEEVTDELEQFVGNYNGQLGFSSSELIKKSMESIKDTIFVVGVVVSGIIGIAGVINFVNLTIANILSRRRELAVMESVGMCRKQIKKLITAESLLYSVLATFFGIAFSAAVGYLLISPISQNIWFMEFNMIIWPSVIISLFIIVITIFLPKLLYRLFNKGSIIEKLRIES